LLVESLVRPTLVVEGGVRRQYPLQMALVQDEQVVQALAAGAADPALGIPIRLRAVRRCVQDLQPFAAEGGVKRLRELPIAVVQHDPGRQCALLQAPGDVACLLGHPGSGWVGGTAGEIDPPSSYLDEEEHNDGLEESALDAEEARSEHLFLIVAEKAAPAGTLPGAHGHGRNLVPLEQVADGGAALWVALLEAALFPAAVV
jgi:hypothetical protein